MEAGGGLADGERGFTRDRDRLFSKVVEGGGGWAGEGAYKIGPGVLACATRGVANKNTSRYSKFIRS